MSDNGKITVRGVVSPNTDYSYPDYDTRTQVYAFTPDYVRAETVRAEVTGDSGTTLDLGNFTSITGVIIKNEDTTNFVTVAWDSASASNSQKIPAGGIAVLPQVDPGADLVLTADTADLTCLVHIYGTTT